MTRDGSQALSKMAAIGLIAGLTISPFGHNGGPPFVLPKAPTVPAAPGQNKRKDPRDPKRRKPLKSWLKKAFTHPKPTWQSGQRMRLLKRREIEIGIHPKYRHGRRASQPEIESWERRISVNAIGADKTNLALNSRRYRNREQLVK